MSQTENATRKTWLTVAAIVGVVSSGLAAWPWGWSGLGLAMVVWASAGIGFMVRHGLHREPLSGAEASTDDASTAIATDLIDTTPPESSIPTTLPDLRSPSQRWLHLTRDVAETARKAASLPDALEAVGQMLHERLGSRAWVCLRVEGWNGESALLRPWIEPGEGGDDHIDPGAMSTVGRQDLPLGQALSLRQPCVVDLADHPQPQVNAPWRTGSPRRVLAVPVIVEDWPVAVLEYLDPAPLTNDQHTVLQVATIQLGFVAQRDTTQARIANDAEHLGRLGLVASRISSGVALLDRHGLIEWINPMFVALTGWPHPKVLGRKLADLLAEEVQDAELAADVTRLMATGGPFRVSYEGSRRNNGSIIRYWGEIDAILMLDESGGRNQYVCLFNDITTRKNQEHQQAQEKEFLEALLGNLPISLMVLDPVDLSVAAINRYAEYELGLKHDEVIKRPIAEVLGPEVLKLTEPQMRKAIRTGEAVDHDFVWQTDKRRFVVNARHFALRHTNGQPRLLITLARDITDQRQASADLEESERRFRELVESMDDGVYVATAGHQLFVYLSPGAPDLLGVTSEALQTQPGLFNTLVIAEDQSLLSYSDPIQDHAAEPADIVLRINHATRGQRWLRRRCRARQLDDGQWRIYGLISDITDERQQALELQRARDVAESASQAKSQFMASMSHEIRTPMNAILGMTELLMGTPLTDKQRRYAQSVFRSGESLLEIINDILDFSKIEAGRLELAPSDFSLQTMLDDTLELMAPRAHEKGIEVAPHFQPGLPPVVYADSLRLQQVITNLVANAIKFTERGEVVVNVRRVDSDLSMATSDLVGQTIELEFSVRDTGIGIPADVIPRLFSAFTQANAGLARRYGGTGLGLAITKQLVELMGGQIEVQSAPGVGSEFTFRVPVVVGHTSTDFAQLDELDMPSLHILVVDDNVTNLTVVENMLTAWGMRVTCAHDGQEALDILLKPTEDLDINMALVDMNMPRLDGMGFAGQLKASGRYNGIKLVLLSSMSTVDDVRRAQDSGFARFVPKPLRKAELRQAILGLSADFMPPSAEMPQLQLQVLVVEDNLINQEVCSHMLSRMGCRVHLASSAMEGLRKLSETLYDVVLMDIQMPGMDGVEALQLFRNPKQGRFQFITPGSVPVVAVTANALEGDEQRFLNLGFDAYLSKPFRLAQLLRVLQSTRPAHSGERLLLPPVLLASTPDPTQESATTHDAPPPAPAPAATWRQVFDDVAVQRLVELDPSGQNHLLERVTKMFAASVEKYLGQIDDAWRAGDLKNVRDVAHTLKSSSANLGALKLSQCCVEIETVIRDQTGVDLGPLILELRTEANRVLIALPLLAEAGR
jgi:two-component system sensor histidine kinase/response regulator